jgi:hypothetical protein
MALSTTGRHSSKSPSLPAEIAFEAIYAPTASVSGRLCLNSNAWLRSMLLSIGTGGSCEGYGLDIRVAVGTRGKVFALIEALSRPVVTELKDLSSWSV